MRNYTIHYSRMLTTIGTLALAVLLLSIFLGCATKQKNPETIPQAVKDALDSTVRLVLKDAEGESLEIGSGFFVHPGLIVTNLHVVKDAVKNDSYAQLVGKKVKYPIEGITRSSKYSLAILKVNAPDVAPVSLGNSDSVQIGNVVYAVGNPPEPRNKISKGKVKEPEKQRLDDIKLDIWEITSPISSGISGGPVLNNEGKVIGVSTKQVLFKKPPVEIHNPNFFSSSSIKTGGRTYFRKGSNFAISSKTLKALLSGLDLANP